MHQLGKFIHLANLITFVVVGLLILSIAIFLANLVEEFSKHEAQNKLNAIGLDRINIQSNGLKIMLSGEVASEVEKLRAVTKTNSIFFVSAIDNITVNSKAVSNIPEFSVEILSNEKGISVIGLIPKANDRDILISKLQEIAVDLPVIDILESIDYDATKNWDSALNFATRSLAKLPNSKISVTENHVRITALTDNLEQKEQLEAELRSEIPTNLDTVIDIVAPRPFINPFRLQYILDKNGGRFDSCSAQDYASKVRILNAAKKAELSGNTTCTIGSGVPPTSWIDAAEQAIAAIIELNGGSVSFENTDISLIGTAGTDIKKFNDVVATLEMNLPEIFNFDAILATTDQFSNHEQQEFIATLSPEGLLQLRGKLNDSMQQKDIESYAKAKFGYPNVYNATFSSDSLPSDWPIRVLTGLKALSILNSGSLVITSNLLKIQGLISNPENRDIISNILSEKLAKTIQFEIDVKTPEKKPISKIKPSAQECETQIATITSVQKITFEPNSATVSVASRDVIDSIAEILTECGNIPLEIQGHTDSQGGENMNQILSQKRANSVLEELKRRHVPALKFNAIGYGESRPIASNQTKTGREKNRRIEFRLYKPEPIREQTTHILDDLALETMSSFQATPAEGHTDVEN
ncbi:MAG: OmpA family protein [Aestuariivita sp.]|nr:OmpA family protein [Aestuariivita sp.]